MSEGSNDAPELEGNVPIGDGNGAGGDGDGKPQPEQTEGTEQPSGLTNDVADLPKSNAPGAGRQDQSKVYGTQETKDYSPAGNPPDRPTITSTNDRDTIQTGPESIGAGGAGNPNPNRRSGVGDGADDTARGDPDAPQGTGPDVNSKTLGSREANGVLGSVRQAGE